ncbi:MAG: Alpha/beta hydrolase [Candidatus Angelobacter sp.]|nr:Alpha/beta hydrolase [Candidatus Angelobacter sp.]
MMKVRSDDAEIAYTVMGSGPDVVLLHAFPSSHELWLPVAEKIGQQYRVTLMDLRGHGDSSVGEGPATMQKHAADVARVCREAGVGTAVFGGISIGGYILFEFWRRYREQVRALMLCNTRASADTEEARSNRLKSAEEVLQRGPEQFIDSMLPKWLGESTRRNRPDLVIAARKTMRGSAAGIAAAQRGMAERPDAMATLKTIDVPTLILAGAEDTLIPMAEAEAMQRNIRGSELQVIPQAGHYSVFERSDDATRVVRQFLVSRS